MTIKKPSKKQMKIVGTVVLVVALVTAGVAGTLGYQKFIADTKAQGVAEYQINDCNKFTDKNVIWLECDE